MYNDPKEPNLLVLLIAGAIWWAILLCVLKIFIAGG